MNRDYGNVRRCYFGEEQIKPVTVIFVHAELVLANIRRHRHLARDSWITLSVDWHFPAAVINVTDVIWMETKVSQFCIFGECRHRETNVWRTHSAQSNGGAVLVVQSMLGFPPVTLSLAQL